MADSTKKAEVRRGDKTGVIQCSGGRRLLGMLKRSRVKEKNGQIVTVEVEVVCVK